MGKLDDLLSAQFARWEQRGRGWHVHPHPVAPEPPFVPFTGYHTPATSPGEDDGRKPSRLASLFERLEQRVNPQPHPLPPEPEPKEPEPVRLERAPLVELQAVLPAGLDIPAAEFAAFLDQLTVCREPVAFELWGTGERIVAQFAVARQDAPIVRRQVAAYFPEVTFLPQEDRLAAAWTAHEGEAALVEFGLEREFLLPLASGGKLDPFVGLIGAMNELSPGELTLFQVLFAPAQEPWGPNAWNAVADAQGKTRFVNRPELPDAVRDKFSLPLYGVVARIATQAPDFDRAWQLARELAFAMRGFAHPQGNALIPLRNDAYSFAAHEQDVLRRQSHRSGMLLNAAELAGLVHFPSSAVRSARLQRQAENSRPAPASVLHLSSLCLGTNTHLGITTPVRLTTEQRTRHLHLVGASGTGKSTLLFNLIRQDLEAGEGLAVLDPHGDLVEKILGVIPEHRMEDVVLLDPADEGYSIGFNLLSAHSDLEKRLLASDLVSVFQRLSTSWGDQMGSVLHNAILAFLESREGGTLADLRRFLIEPAFRTQFLTTVSDPDLRYYWTKAFPQLSGNKSIGPVLTRLDTFLAPKPLRYMVSQRENRLDFADLMDRGKVFLAKLPQGLIGRENAFLLGSLLVSKFQQLAMSRQGQRAEARRPYWLYVDEFQQFITPSMAEILTGARKYRLGLILAHQELRQLERDREVAGAVLANAHTRVVFRVGDADAATLAAGFTHFTARDVQNLTTGQALCRVERADAEFNLTVPLPAEPDAEQAEATRQRVTEASRRRYATPRAEIEAALRASLAAEEPHAKANSVPPPEPKRTTPPTRSEKESVPVPAPPPAQSVPEEQRSSSPPPDMGKGGAQHKAIQARLKAGAESFGFHATIEQAVPDGGIDLVLVRGNDRIACEVSVTTTVDHEVGNVQKCLRAGFPRVAVICPEAARLEKIRAAVQASLGPEATTHVSYATPDEFLAQLAALPLPAPPPTSAPAPESPTIRKGYAVKRKSATVSAEERAAREQAAIAQMAEVMKPRGRKK